ncbi:hypothetical protein CLF_106302 [Clonorchis sinensis]|uniref:ISXO2-like transposase domain-containing protein n=1 Tax=Clonorchis sinensis TaxID=79923 RepID=G7YPV3_CLOSI|nr:hypothetical protein CLF_106302 [Clonorchis sinensis]
MFGGICRETKEVFTYAVPDRTAATLIDTIQACIAPGSIIISDMWAPYQGIEIMIDMNYTHETVKHTKKFVDPTTGAHTQTIVYKVQNNRQCGTHRSLVVSYLCEFVWGQRYLKRTFSCKLLMTPQFYPLQ